MPRASEQERLRRRIPASTFTQGGSDAESEDPVSEEKDALAIVPSSSPNEASQSPEPPTTAPPEPALPPSSGTFGKNDTIQGKYTFEDDQGHGNISVDLDCVKLTVQPCENEWSLSQGDFVNLDRRLFASDGYLAKAKKKEFCYLMRKLPSLTRLSLFGVLLPFPEEDQIVLEHDSKLPLEKPQLQRLHIEGSFSGAPISSISPCRVELFCSLTKLKTLVLVNTAPSDFCHSAIRISSELADALNHGPMTMLWLAGVHPHWSIYTPVAFPMSTTLLDFAILLDLGSVIQATEQLSFAAALIKSDDRFHLHVFTLDVKVPASVGPFALVSQTRESLDDVEKLYDQLSPFNEILLKNLQGRLESGITQPFTFQYRLPMAAEHPIRKLVQNIKTLDGASDGHIVIETLRHIW